MVSPLSLIDRKQLTTDCERDDDMKVLCEYALNEVRTVHGQGVVIDFGVLLVGINLDKPNSSHSLSRSTARRMAKQQNNYHIQSCTEWTKNYWWKNDATKLASWDVISPSKELKISKDIHTNNHWWVVALVWVYD